MELVFFFFFYYWSIIDIQCYITFRCIAYWFNNSVHYLVITMISVITICLTIQCFYYWLYSLCFTFHLSDHRIIFLSTHMHLPHSVYHFYLFHLSHFIDKMGKHLFNHKYCCVVDFLKKYLDCYCFVGRRYGIQLLIL